MTFADFGRAVMPTLASHNGRSRVAAGSFNAANNPTGVDVWQFAAGRPDLAHHLRGWRGPFRGDPSLSPNGRLIAFSNAEDRGEVHDVDSGALVWTLPRLQGNHALKMRNEAVVYQTADGIYEQALAGGEPRRVGDYSATGLGYLTPAGVVTWEQNRAAYAPIYAPAHVGELVIGEGANGGILALPEGFPVVRMLPDSGGEWHDIAACGEGGTVAIAAWLPNAVLRVWCVTRAEIAAWPMRGAAVPPPVIPDPVLPPVPPDLEPPMPDILAELEDQLPLVTETRNRLFPNLIGQPLNDPRKAFAVTRNVAWALRHLGIGLVKAKPGSDNNVDGYVTDIVALASGDHWDVLQDGNEGASFPRWAKEENPANNIPIKARWVPAIAPSGGDNGDPGDENDAKPLPPVGNPPVLCNCGAELAEVRKDISLLTDALMVFAELVGQIVDEKLSELPTPEPVSSFPAYEGRIFGQKIRLEPKA